MSPVPCLSVKCSDCFHYMKWNHLDLSSNKLCSNKVFMEQEQINCTFLRINPSISYKIISKWMSTILKLIGFKMFRVYSITFHKNHDHHQSYYTYTFYTQLNFNFFLIKFCRSISFFLF